MNICSRQSTSFNPGDVRAHIKALVTCHMVLVQTLAVFHLHKHPAKCTLGEHRAGQQTESPILGLHVAQQERNGIRQWHLLWSMKEQGRGVGQHLQPQALEAKAPDSDHQMRPHLTSCLKASPLLETHFCHG